jgi:hypothetical protein
MVPTTDGLLCYCGSPTQGFLSLIIPVTMCGSYWSASSIYTRLRYKAVICKVGQPLQGAFLHSPAASGCDRDQRHNLVERAWVLPQT